LQNVGTQSIFLFGHTCALGVRHGQRTGICELLKVAILDGAAKALQKLFEVYAEEERGTRHHEV